MVETDSLPDSVPDSVHSVPVNKSAIGCQELPKISYDDFLKLPKSFCYFPNQDPKTYAKMAPNIKSLLIDRLHLRPYEESELFEELSNTNPTLAGALEFILDQVEQEFVNPDQEPSEWRKALDSITKGIEIRYNKELDIRYWGLTSRLDKA